MAWKFQIVHRKTGEPVPCSTFTDGDDARAWHRYLETPSDYYIKLIPDETDPPSPEQWRERETLRYAYSYDRPVWAGTWWWAVEHRDHFAHVSLKDPRLIAFTQSEDKGRRDIQTPMKPGAYLKKYFSDVLSDEEIKRWATEHGARYGEVEFKIATSSEQIVAIYLKGPNSCMAAPASRYKSNPIHPVSVYGDGSDLTLAYLCHADRVTARALIWQDRKQYGRIYGDEIRLKRKLDELGFKHGDFNGAKLNRLETDNGYIIAPYLDGADNVDDCDEYLQICYSGDYSCLRTDGIAEEQGTRCECCNGRIQRGTGSDVLVGLGERESWCDDCVGSNAYYCHGFNDYVSDDLPMADTEDEDEPVSLLYAERYMVRCERTDKWCDRVRTVHTANGDEHWGGSALDEDAFQCERNDAWYSADDFEQIEVIAGIDEDFGCDLVQTWSSAHSADYFRSIDGKFYADIPAFAHIERSHYCPCPEQGELELALAA